MTAPGTQRSQPLLTISVVSHGDAQPLRELLKSVAQYERIGQIQLLVTDNLGDDLPNIDPDGWYSVSMLRSPRPMGFAENHNRAFAASVGRFFCVLNPDVQFPQSVFESLLARLGSSQAHMAAPVFVDSSGRIQDSFRALPTPGRIFRRLKVPSAVSLPDQHKAFFPDWVAGMFMFLARNTFAQLGGFDARYRLYFEDVDLCTRLRLAGMRIVVDPSLRLLHDPRRRSRRPGLHLLWHTQSAARFFLSAPYRRARKLKNG